MADSREEERSHLCAGEEILLGPGMRVALELYAPHVPNATYGKVMSYKYRALVVSIQDKVVVKRGFGNTETEEKNMRFVSGRFSLPLPRVLGLHTDSNGWVFLVIEFVEGKPLDLAWPDLQAEEKKRVAADLKTSVDRMRQVTATYIGALGRKEFPMGHDLLHSPHAGPFETEEEFVEAILREFDSAYEHHTPVFRKMLSQSSGHKFLFTHGDLQMKNILVHQGRVSAIVDWEHAGFYPEYWEYANAWYDLPWSRPELEDYPLYLQPAFQRYPVEAATLELVYTKPIFGY